MLTFLIFACGVGLLAAGIYAKNVQGRRAALFAKYQNWDVVNGIMEGRYWKGQSAAQLIDSLGPPVDRDLKALKNKDVLVWKYHQTGKNRYRLRITLEDNVVVSYEEKS